MRHLLFAIALLSSPALAVPPTVLHASLDPTIGAVYSDAPSLETLSGWLWVAPGDLFGEPLSSDWAPVRVVTDSPGALYVTPYPAEGGRHALRVMEAPLLFADGFERGDLWTWAGAVGADPSLRAGGETDLRLAMAESVGWFNVLSFSGLDSGGSTVYVLLSEGIAGGSASTDTPASKRYRYTLRSFDSVSWKAIRQASGWPDLGGVIDHADYHVVADNTRNPTTNVGPLDDLQGLTFKDQAITNYGVRLVWDDTLKGWYPEDLADAQVLWKGTILDAAFAGVTDSEFSLAIREQTKVGLAVPASPVEYQGLGGGVKVETGGGTGSGARIVRADVAAGRGTGDQSIAWGFLRGTGDTGSSAYTFFDHPTVRLRRDVATDTIIAQMKNAAGTFQTIGTSPTFTANTFFGIAVTYDLASTTAELWVNGVSAGTKVITGGIFASSASSVYWYNAPTTGTMEITHYFFRQWSRLLADSEIEDRSVYSFDFGAEAGLIAAIEFTERSGTILSDRSGTEGAVLTGFSDVSAAWVSSATGEAAQARQRPRVFVGSPFLAAVDLIDAPFGIYSPGYGQDNYTRLIRAVVANGKRLAPPISSVSSPTQFWLTAQQVMVTTSAGHEDFLTDPAVGQVLNFSTGTNVGNHTVAQVLNDPRSPEDYGQSHWIAAGDVIADEAIGGNWTTATSDWSVASSLIPGLVAVRVTSNAADHMATLLQYLGALNGPVAYVFLTKLGPEASVTTTNIVSHASGTRYGWQGDGNAESLGVVDDLARKTPSNSDNSPSVVHRNSSGTWLLTGSDLSPASASYTWDSLRIKSATQAAFPGRYNKVRVRWAKAWSQPSAGAVAQSSTIDILAREATTEWREVMAGTGSRELLVDAYFLLRDDAQAFANAILSMLSGKLYLIELYGPIKTTEAAMAPFTAVTVDWSADTYLDGGVKGIVVALDVHPDKSATALVFFGS